MESGQFQRVETQPDEKPDRFSIFLNTKSNKSKRMSINRLSLQSDIMDSVPRFRKTKYHHPFRNTLSNHSFLSKTTNPFDISNVSVLKEEKEEDKKNKKGNKKIPENILNKIDINKENELLSNTQKEFESSLKELSDIQSKLENSKKKYNKLLKELGEAKDSRNKIIQEVYQMKSEIENQKNLATESGYVPTLTNTSYSNNELAEQIELYEDKICKLKMDNQTFLENYDNLCDDCKQNESQNQKLKKAIAQLEQNINNAINEKSYLKSMLDKAVL